MYRVLLDERWKLSDLYEFPRAYEQAYSFVYCFDTSLDPRNAARIDTALLDYPWQGGYSYVNIYTVLANQVPTSQRPKVQSISYASPGWLDILLNSVAALQIAAAVGILVRSGAAAAAYSSIQTRLAAASRERRQMQVDKARPSPAEIRETMRLADMLAEHMGFKSVAELDDRTQNADVTLKLLMAHYRRLETLARFVRDGKAQLPNEMHDEG